VTQRGARAAIHSRARFSAAAVNERFTRRALKKGKPFLIEFAFVVMIEFLRLKSGG
jgi:hypothetical protein